MPNLTLACVSSWLCSLSSSVRRYVQRFAVAVLLLVGAVPLSWAQAGTALQFNGSNQYVTFGPAPGLGASTFTIEIWFKRTGAGLGTSTGSGGLASAVPLLTKGRAEADGSNLDMNYFLGIDATSAKLVADFEEGPSTGGTLGLNHPITGNTVIALNTWYHAAATYDGQTWKLYVNGALDGTLTLSVPRPPRADSIQHAALATAMNSTGVPAGYFLGILDEARVWNYARTQAEIQATKDQEITAPTTGLLGRWGMNEGAGTVVADTAAGINGTAVNTPTWVGGFPLPDTIPPAAPQNVTAEPGNALVSVYWDQNSEPDLAGYNIYRSLTSPVDTSGSPVNGSTLLTAPTFTDRGLVNGTPYFYSATAVDNSGNKSAASNEASTTPQVDAGSALRFDGSTQYVTFGQASAVGASAFTIEVWFKRTGPGIGTNTGAGGIPDIIPLLAKGRAEADGSNVDMNYILGIQASTNKLAADFEDMATGGNHPVVGNTVITQGVWHHAAATYDGSAWQLYLDGVSETSSAANQTPRYDSIQHASLASALNSTGVAAGYFAGVLDEARIWNYARSQSEILSTKNYELTSASGLIARWGMNEAAGSSIADSSGTGVNGTLVGNPLWVAGFPKSANQPPIVNAGPDQTITLPATASLTGTATDDGLPNPPGALSVTWSVASGPGTVTFSSPGSLSTDASFSMSGTYILNLSADDGEFTSNDQVTITVNPVIVVNQPPVVDAGPDQTITLPAAASLAGSATDDGLPNPPGTLTISWSQISGPGTASFADSTAASTTAVFSAPGVYVLRLAATDTDLSASDDVTVTVNPVTGNYGLDFGSSNAYVTFGNPSKLHLATFTVEAWFKREGVGSTTTTGTNGIANAIPLVARGRGEAENPLVDLNYFLGIDSTNNVLAADFEEGASGANPSQNHPVFGVTPIANNVWHHAAATYDGSKWQLFLDGVLEAQLTVGQPTAAAGNQYASIGSALDSTGAAQGFFNGVIDEVRIWDHALPASEILANINTELTSGSGLVARWGLNEGTGSSVTDSIAAPVGGTVTGTGWTWVNGAPFNITVNHPPDTPILNGPPDGALNVTTPPALDVTASDPDGGPLAVSFYGRVSGSNPGPDFSLIVLPDTQNYTASLSGGTPAMFAAQTQWVVDNASILNVAYVTQVGDITNDGDNNETEWTNASNAMALLENPSLMIPYGVEVGNHDQTPTGDPSGTTTYYNQYFGMAHFAGRPYYGGNYGSNNDNHYDLFTAGGIDFIVIYIEYGAGTNASVLAWADGLLKTYANRRGIIIPHNLMGTGNPATFSSEGSSVYNALKNNPNLFLMLGGHAPGEGQRQDTYGGHTVYSLLADYQSRAHGGDGWLRVLQFSPSANTIHVKTYSPTLNQWETDADSQFDLPYNMGSSSFTLLDTKNITSGGTATTSWNGLAAGTTYEWYATVSDGTLSTTGPAWTFTTAAKTNHPPVADPQSVTLNEDTPQSITLSGSDPDGDALTFSTVTFPAHGTLSGTGSSQTYTPDANYNGSDSFSFKVNDGTVDSNVATISIFVNAVNDAPVLTVPGGQFIDEAQPLTFQISATDPDVGDALTFSATGLPSGATFNASTQQFSWTPAYSQAGSYTVTFTVTDLVLSDSKTVSITVRNVNRAPVANDQTVTTSQGVAVAIVVTASDPDGDALTYSVANPPAHGSLTGVAPNLTYTPAAGFTGSDSFTFTANDGTVDSNPATLTIHVVGLPATATGLSTSLNPSQYGESVTFTATVTSGSGTPSSGNVTFTDGVATIATAAVDATGHASVTTSALTVNSHSIVASYSGSASFAPSVSAPVIQVVNQAGSTITLSSNQNPSMFNQPVTFTATVKPQWSGSATGPVRFYDNGILLGSVALAGNSAQLTTSTLLRGSHTITASYEGDTNVLPSLKTLAQSVAKGSTSTKVTASPNPAVIGQMVTFTATVTPTYGGNPTGNVTFKLGTTVLSVSPLSGGTAVFSTSNLAAGTKTITASFGGDSSFSTSSGSVAEKITKTPTSTALNSSLNPSVYGQSVTFTATVTTSGGGTPTGTVTFKRGSVLIGTVTLDVGVATLSTSALTAGSGVITAVYSGDAMMSSSTSPGLTQVIKRAATGTAVTSSLNPSIAGQSVTFTVTLTSAAGVPTGSVTFKDGATVLGSVPLSGGIASFTTSALTAGTHNIKAVYAATTNYGGSSASLTQIVN